MSIKILLILFGLSWASSHPYKPFYRKDYVFVPEFNAFYKFHWDAQGGSWDSVFLACVDEGAKIFYPKEKGEWAVVKNLTEKLEDALNTTDILVGIHDEFGFGEYITVDGHSTPAPLTDVEVIPDGEKCVFMDIDTGKYKIDMCNQEIEYGIKPFVCKKVDEKWCPTIDTGYWYEKDTRKCYKIHTRPKTWQDALHTCFMEGGILLSIENSHEARTLYDRAHNINNNEYLFTGFKAKGASGEFYTVKGIRLSESGYSDFYGDISINNFCGTMYKYNHNFYYRTDNCLQKLPFICEMQPRPE